MSQAQHAECWLLAVLWYCGYPIPWWGGPKPDCLACLMRPHGPLRWAHGNLALQIGRTSCCFFKAKQSPAQSRYLSTEIRSCVYGMCSIRHARCKLPSYPHFHSRGGGCVDAGSPSVLTAVAMAKWSCSWKPAGSLGSEPGTCTGHTSGIESGAKRFSCHALIHSILSVSNTRLGFLWYTAACQMSCHSL